METKEKPKFLSDRIIQMEKEKGIESMTCKEEDCLHIKYEPKIAKGYYGRTHCREKIPYVKKIHGELRLVPLCIHKIRDYWGDY